MERHSRFLVLLSPVFLSGCLSIGEVASSGAASLGSTIGTAFGGPIAGIATGVVSGLAAGAASPNYEAVASDVDGFWSLLAYAWQTFTPNIIGIVAVIGGLWILAGYVGLRMKRPEETRAEKQVNELLERITRMKPGDD